MSEPINRYTMPIQGENLPRKCLRGLARWRTTEDRGKPPYLLSPANREVVEGSLLAPE
jgi:hypothetical protein